MSDSKSYKALKEEFVSNLTGGSITEINLVTAVAPAAYILFAAFQSRIQFFRPTFGVPQLLIDYCINVCAIILSTTLYSSFPILLILLLLAPVAVLHLAPAHKVKHKPRIKAKADVENELPRKSFLTVYRGSMMVITCIAILAVDFKFFPRRFAKVENWGTSLMDLGVGSFVFSSGIVAARPVLKERWRGTFVERMMTAARTAAPLVALGFVRLAMVKGVEYAEHVTEYGVHWNFFFTLAFLSPFVAAAQSLLPTGGSAWGGAALSLLMGVVYQCVLDSTGLKEYILVGDRRDYRLVGMNKEGLSSFFGYLAISLAGQATGFYVLPREPAGSRKVLKMLVGWSVGWTALFMLVNAPWGASVDVSRRLANLPYFLWVAAFNTAQLAAFYTIEWVFFRRSGAGYGFAVPRVLEAFNRNGLALFLLANLLTGLVNVSINTLEVGRFGALMILMGYMGVLTAVALILDYFDLSVKL